MTIQKDTLGWHNFAIQAKRAASRAGFSDAHGWQLTASMVEIYTNIVEHSERVESGLVAYSAGPGYFDYVISDAGIGILKSLRKNSQFSDLMDSGTALELALGEGVSRHTESGRGMGFRPIFVGLANISRKVRFRSGDYGRELERLSDGTLPATTMQRARIDGLFCYVRCELG